MTNKELEIEVEDMLQEKGRTNLPGDLDPHDNLDHGTTNISAEVAEDPEDVLSRGTTNIPTDEGIEAEEGKLRTTNLPEDLSEQEEAEIEEILETKGTSNLPGDATIADTDVEIEEMLQEKGTTNLPGDLDPHDELDHGTTNISVEHAEDPESPISRGTTNTPNEAGIEAEAEKGRTTNVPEIEEEA